MFQGCQRGFQFKCLICKHTLYQHFTLKIVLIHSYETLHIFIKKCGTYLLHLKSLKLIRYVRRNCWEREDDINTFATILSHRYSSIMFILTMNMSILLIFYYFPPTQVPMELFVQQSIRRMARRWPLKRFQIPLTSSPLPKGPSES